MHYKKKKKKKRKKKGKRKNINRSGFINAGHYNTFVSDITNVSFKDLSNNKSYIFVYSNNFIISKAFIHSVAIFQEGKFSVVLFWV